MNVRGVNCPIAQRLCITALGDGGTELEFVNADGHVQLFVLAPGNQVVVEDDD